MSTPMEIDEQPPVQQGDEPKEVVKGKGKAKDSAEKKRFEVKKVKFLQEPKVRFTDLLK